MALDPTCMLCLFEKIMLAFVGLNQIAHHTDKGIKWMCRIIPYGIQYRRMGGAFLRNPSSALQ